MDPYTPSESNRNIDRWKKKGQIIQDEHPEYPMKKKE
jgi:hypothetical protein